MTDISERIFPLDDELSALAGDAGAEGRELLLLPEFVEEIEGTLVAAFAETTQEFRVDLTARGVSVGLALPTGAEPRPYQLHFVEYVLPIILAVPGAVASTAQIVGWLRQRHTESPGQVLRYREARFDEVEGKYVVRELVGPADQVAEVLERFESARQLEGSGERPE